jgi:hypothetical protein
MEISNVPRRDIKAPLHGDAANLHCGTGNFPPLVLRAGFVHEDFGGRGEKEIPANSLVAS